MPGPSKIQKPICNGCNVPLVLGINCKPSSFKHGTYLCRECMAKKSRDKRIAILQSPDGPAFILKDRERVAKWRRANPRKDLAVQIRGYGLSVEELEEQTNKQNNLCKLCGKPPGVNPRQKRLCIDHDHQTGRFRGLLCDPCNRAIGILGDNIESFARILLYLANDYQTAENAIKKANNE